LAKVELVLYRDLNGVTVMANPIHVVAVVFDRMSTASDWTATIRLDSGDTIKLCERKYQNLVARVRYGDQ
jgi:hypothetical protein